MKSKMLNRRRFLQRSLVTTGCLTLPTIVPAAVFGRNGRVATSERITVGCIGVGGHGTSVNLKSYLAQSDAHVLAVCDVDANHLERARQLVFKAYGNRDCAAEKDFRTILQRTDIDAVMISTPDHWHVPMSIMALKAGKDVQCEKPTLTIDEGKRLVKTVRRYGKVFQTSTEDRSVGVYHRMAELVRNGRIGRLQTIRVTLPYQPGRLGDPTPQPIPPELDYEMWLGPAPYAPYTKDRVHFHYRWIQDYSGGIIMDWGTHLFDTAQWANDTEHSGPVRIEAQGSFWKGGLYDTPKTYHVEYTYANGVKLIVDHGGTGIRCEGTEGWIESPSWRANLKASNAKILDAKIGPDEVQLYTHPGGEHRDFLDCVKTRRDPYFPVDIGHRVSTVCHLGNIALELGRPLQWDPNREVFVNDAQANRRLSRPMRSPWHLI